MTLHDLSHPIEPGMPTYPGDPVVETYPNATHEEEGFSLTAFGLSTHSGTHVDAPVHVEPDGKSLDAFPVERFRYDARLVRCDVESEEAIGPDALPPRDDAELYVFDTGWSQHWGDISYFEHPYLSPECASVCADRGVDVAVDGPSVDPVGGDLMAHHELFREDCLVIENVRGLAELPDRFTVHAYPLPLGDADGAPARVVAEVE
ncbi:cyclase family protein [Halomarina oriensis]|uniref:Cyclase family protein n=1 Tax=Halomarina oriensis TaxID=671145 RepID=A0A6B0GGS3_9EURY|nr:cyclase family protein [Halomarina oriensis]MWG34106.1 cyclase family protein [Halomarina oriensis]